jgi:hypothetical protein
MAGRKITDEADARTCLSAARSHRGRTADWARANGVDDRSLNAWRVNLERRAVSPRRASRRQLIQLVPATPLAATRPPFLLRVARVELELAVDFHEPSLARLLTLLKSC